MIPAWWKPLKEFSDDELKAAWGDPGLAAEVASEIASELVRRRPEMGVVLPSAAS